MASNDICRKRRFDKLPRVVVTAGDVSSESDATILFQQNSFVLLFRHHSPGKLLRESRREILGKDLESQSEAFSFSASEALWSTNPNEASQHLEPKVEPTQYIVQ